MREHKRTVCFTGHRPNKLPWLENERDARCVQLKEAIFDALEQLYAEGYRHFICGMARGCDVYYAEAVLRLRALRSDVTLEAAVPCDDQISPLAEEHVRYDRILAECDEVTYVSHAYFPGCMQKRNIYMVDHADAVLAVFNGTCGGTMNTLTYAMRCKRQIVMIDLNEYQ